MPTKVIFTPQIQIAACALRVVWCGNPLREWLYGENYTAAGQQHPITATLPGYHGYRISQTPLSAVPPSWYITTWVKGEKLPSRNSRRDGHLNHRYKWSSSPSSWYEFVNCTLRVYLRVDWSGFDLSPPGRAPWHFDHSVPPLRQPPPLDDLCV